MAHKSTNVNAKYFNKIKSIGRKALAECKNIKIKGGKEMWQVKKIANFLCARFGKITFLIAII